MTIAKKIVWNRFGSRYVRLQTGVEKRLILTEWREGEWFNRPGIGFTVLNEDGASVKREFTVTSRRLIQELRPVILKADKEQKDLLRVAITRLGEGLKTQYRVRELPPSYQELFKGGDPNRMHKQKDHKGDERPSPRHRFEGLSPDRAQ